jgi:hypothetical protein
MGTIARRPIDQMRAEWEVVARAPQSAHALGLLASAEPEVGRLGVDDLGGLVSAMHGAQDLAGRERAARILQAMLRSQEVHPLIPRAILQAIVPGLVGVARRLAWGRGGEWDDGGAFFADVVATAWEVIVAWSGEDRDYAVLDLLSAIRCRLRRQVLGQRTGSEQLVYGLEPDDPRAPRTNSTVSDLEHLAAVIDELRGNGLDPGDAAVIYGTRVLGLSMAEMARMTGRSRRHLDGRRRRAERQLCA